MKKRTSREVIEAIHGTSGVKLLIARNLRVHRHTVDEYLKIYPTAQKAFDDECEKIGDFAISNIAKAILDGNLKVSMWYAETKLQDRGFAKRIENTGKGGGPIDVNNNVRAVDIERLKRVLLAYHTDVEGDGEGVGEIGVGESST